MSDAIFAVVCTAYASSAAVAICLVVFGFLTNERILSLKTLGIPFIGLILSFMGMIVALPLTIICATTFLWPATVLGLFATKVPRLVSILVTGLIGASAFVLTLYWLSSWQTYHKVSTGDSGVWQVFAFGMIPGSAAGWMWDKFARPKPYLKTE